MQYLKEDEFARIRVRKERFSYTNGLRVRGGSHMMLQMRIFLRESAKGKKERAALREYIMQLRQELANLDADSSEAAERQGEVERLRKVLEDAPLEKFLSPSHGVSRRCRELRMLS
jgi:hypothetical protein